MSKTSFWLLAFFILSFAAPTDLSAQLVVDIPPNYSREPEEPKERWSKDSGRDGDDSSRDNSSQSAPAKAQPQVISEILVPGTPGMTVGMLNGSPVAFTNLVLTGRGKLRFSIRRQFGDRNSYFFVAADNVQGHGYITLNSLGKSRFTVEQVMSIVKQDFPTVFPWLDAVGRKYLDVGNEYILSKSFMGVGTSNPVTVTNSTPYTFTLTTKPGHSLKGAATHGFFVDETGELWLFQAGTGQADETFAEKNIAYTAAPVMWERMAENVKSLLDRTPQAPVVGVPGKTKDGIHYRF